VPDDVVKRDRIAALLSRGSTPDIFRMNPLGSPTAPRAHGWRAAEPASDAAEGLIGFVIPLGCPAVPVEAGDRRRRASRRSGGETHGAPPFSSVLSSRSRLGIGAAAVATARDESEVPREVEIAEPGRRRNPIKGGSEIRLEVGDSAGDVA
jgi:hypothetical protein